MSEPQDNSDDDLGSVTGGGGGSSLTGKLAKPPSDQDDQAGVFSTHAQMLQSGQSIGSGAMNQATAKGAEADADKARLEALVQQQTAAQNNADFMKAYQDNIKAVIDKLSDIQKSEAYAMRAITRG